MKQLIYIKIKGEEEENKKKNRKEIRRKACGKEVFKEMSWARVKWCMLAIIAESSSALL